MFWHVALAVLLMVVVKGPRPSARATGYLLVLPVVSVSALAWVTGNPFNAVTFAVLTLVLLHAAARLPRVTVTLASRRWVLAGAALVAFGWAYPHFVRAPSWMTYAYASPFGLLPCPTLSAVIGITVIADGLRSPRWSLYLSAAGLLYGLLGVFGLGVRLDVGLVAAAILLAVMAARFPRSHRAVTDVVASATDAPADI